MWSATATAAAESNIMAAPGFVVSPIYQNVSIGADQPTAHYTVSLSNTTTTDQAFKLSTVDFGSLDDSGGVAFLGTSTSSFAKKYGLSDWMKLDQSSTEVPAGQTVELGVTIENSASLTSGGHYGAILATALTAPNGPLQKTSVGVLEVVSSLILLIKQGYTQATMDLVSQSLDGGWWKMPSIATDIFQATGNVHVIPRGVVEVKDPTGHIISRGSMNENSGIILPGMTRRYETPLMKMAAARLPGLYTVTSTYRVDGSTAAQTLTSTFWYLGWSGFIGLLVLAVLLVAFGLGLWWWAHRRKLT